MSFFGGATAYKGDLGSPAFPFAKPNSVGGMGMVFELNNRMLIRTDMYYGKVSGSDELSMKNKERNLSFASKVTEFSLTLEYNLFDLNDYAVSPYFFLGVGTFKFSPYTFDENGRQVMLAELGTEGQGFYQGREEYKLQELAIPFGGGLQWELSPNKRIALELGFRKTNTDYLDDVSTTYVDAKFLEQNKGGTSQRMAFRGDELNSNLSYPRDGAIRGNPNNKDWYLFTGLSYRVSLQPKPRERVYKFKPMRAKTSCPTLF
jgi:hypothetical protein